MTMAESYFQQDTQLSSLCAICVQRGQDPKAFFNGDVYYLAQAQQRPYLGLTEPTAQPKLRLSKKQRRFITTLLQNFATSPAIVHQVVPLSALAKQVILLEDGELPLPDTGVFNDVMAYLGFELGSLFHQNQLDYTTRQLIREKYQHTCQYCGRRGDSVDHKDPVFVSQDNSLANLTLACQECNRLKGDMPYALFQRLNAQIKPLNQALVGFENTLNNLQQMINTNRHTLAAQQHLTSDPSAPVLEPFRRKAKDLQFVYDSVQSDYQKRIQLRHDFIVSNALVHQRYQS
ncbi:hypothetical protein FC83_GL003262 [Agrilactobacillus composti DSM 18527 = JCM 14202]|uniref:HNH nuclease domain-containing protein n=1 Tax=Agrilactobacillus composti DSM 18527 = JCM 14202 TaxID=1423734 RepID=A0A0R1XTV7_9LACO|nr:hypothetical protein FC83_GL003262 [Agrilactobacillus composti DSM 18527 = JCM 14202]